MDKDQKEAALALQEGYKSSFKQLQAEVQKLSKEAMEKAQDSGDFMATMKEAVKAGKVLTDKGEKLEKGFLEDVKSLLNDSQKEKWPRVERARRRDTAMRIGFMSGQNVDLVKMLAAAGVKPDATPEIADQVERYEVQIDKDLQAFENWGKDQQANQVKAMEDGSMFDMSKVQDMMKKMGELSKAQVDTNSAFAKSIAAVLPPDKQEKFETEVKKKSFPRVYRESYVSKAIAEAEKFADLDGEQKSAVSELKSGYARELDAANKTWAAAIRDREEKNGGSLGMMMMMGQGDGKDEVGQARKARKDLDERTKEKLLATLKEDQKKRLPEDKPEAKDNNPMAGFMNIDPPEAEDE
jgi:hypothetical protein